MAPSLFHSRAQAECCPVCRGHLVADVYIDTIDAGGHVWIRALRCVRCRTLADGAVAVSGDRTRGSLWKRRRAEFLDLADEVTPLGT